MPNNDMHNTMTAAVNDAVARIAVIAGLAAIALIHILQVPDGFHEIGYLGALFIATGAAAVLLAALMTRTDHDVAWAAAGCLAAVVLICYIISRSVGIPGFTGDMGEWADPRGLASMVAESAVVCVSAAVLMTHRAPVAGRAAGTAMRAEPSPGPA